MRGLTTNLCTFAEAVSMTKPKQPKLEKSELKEAEEIECRVRNKAVKLNNQNLKINTYR